MKNSAPLVIVAAVLLAVLDATLWAGVGLDYWSSSIMWFAFWGQSVAIAAILLFVYAKHLFVFFLVLVLISYMLGLKSFLFMGETQIPVSFWGFYSLAWLMYFEMRRSFLGHQIRMHKPLVQLACYFGYMSISILAACGLTTYVYFRQIYLPSMQLALLEQFLPLAIGIPTLTITLLKIIDMIGEKHVFHFLLGTYHRPVDKKNIVVFIDMVGSSAAAEKLTPRQSMEMVSRFIFDASYSCRSHGGDIVNYTGDGLMAIWPVFDTDNVLKAIDKLHARLEASREAYKNDFGIVPDFRMGIHSGSVVICQVGEEKLFLSVYGDVVNTASRLEQANKDHGTQVLMSRVVKSAASKAVQARIRPVGRIDVRGREGDIEVFTLGAAAGGSIGPASFAVDIPKT